MKNYTFKFLHYGIVVSAILIGVLGYNLFKGDKSAFLSGDATHGHFQIELECNQCHVKAFADQDSMQSACESCHAKELSKVNDSHPMKKFTDPRNADLLKSLDARFCVTCHVEHKTEITRKSGVTIAPDFCFHCHSEIKEERESHRSFEFDNCASSGCHNFHDNSMLYEDFLIKHHKENDLSEKHTLPERTELIRWLKKNKNKKPLSKDQHDWTKIEVNHQQQLTLWETSTHAKTAVNCSSCHDDSQSDRFAEKWCKDCHIKQIESFYQGKHGLRESLGLSAMQTDLARAKMQHGESLELSCKSCHDPHSLNIQKAAVESCLGCHDDQHSKNYKNSKHYNLWYLEQIGKADSGAGVTCATCHLPRVKKGKKIFVEHNQNAYLTPNSKMLKTSCLHCHGLEFSLNALADEQLILDNFNRAPDVKLDTFDLIDERIELRKKRNSELEQ